MSITGSELTFAPQQENKPTKGRPKKGKALTFQQEVINQIETVDQDFGAGFSSSIMLALLSKKDEIKNLASESDVTAYVIEVAKIQAIEMGEKRGKARAEREQQLKKIAEIKNSAEQYMSKFEDYIQSLFYICNGDFEKTKAFAIKSAKVMKIVLNIDLQDNIPEWDWEIEPSLVELEQKLLAEQEEDLKWQQQELKNAQASK